MDRRIGLAIAVIIGALLVGVGAYQAGLAQGVAQGVVTTGQGAPALPYGYWYHPFGFGFGFLGFLLPLAFIFLLFAAFRGGRGRGNWGPRTGMLDDWHRRAHDERQGRGPTSDTPTQR